MIAKTGPAKKSILIEEHFRAPSDKVFKAWTKPSSLKKWFMAEQQVKVIDAGVDLHVGGAYFIEVLYPGYPPTTINGEFLEIVMYKFLGYTWLTPMLGDAITKVEVAFQDLGMGSKITLRHGEFDDVDTMQAHIDGWTGCLGELHGYLQTV